MHAQVHEGNRQRHPMDAPSHTEPGLGMVAICAPLMHSCWHSQADSGMPPNPPYARPELPPSAQQR